MTTSNVALMERSPELGRRPIGSDEDATLLSSYLRDRHPEAFARLVKKHEAPVFRLVASILGPGHSADAEDLTQDIFIHVYHKLDGFRFASRFSTWLYRIAYRKAIDEKRKARYRYPHLGDELLAQQPGPSPDPLQGSMGREAKRTLRALVATLGEPHRTAVLLYYWKECSVEEIAAVLGAKQTTVRSYLFRARARLRKMTEEER